MYTQIFRQLLGQQRVGSIVQQERLYHILHIDQTDKDQVAPQAPRITASVVTFASRGMSCTERQTIASEVGLRRCQSLCYIWTREEVVSG